MKYDDLEMRQVYCAEMIKYAAKDDRIMVLEADLAASTGTAKFKEAYPERFVNVGIAEQNMVGIAAGLATTGKLPFVHSFTPFVTRRCLDQIAISVMYSKQNVKIVGTDPGIMATNNGGTHMSLEDVGIMRSIPGTVIFEPCDATVLRYGLPQVIKHPSSVYMRLFRKKAVTVFDTLPTNFDIFKATEIKAGKDVTIIATGIMVARAIEASEKAKEFGLDVGVLCIHTTKPLDEEAVIKAAKRTGAIVVAENHNIYGGLGSAVCETLSENCPVPVERVGVRDRFGEVGNEQYLAHLLGLTVVDILDAVSKVARRKG